MDKAQDCSPEIKAFECLKITFGGRGNRVGKREAISKLHGFSFRRKEKSFGGGCGEERREHIFWASLRFMASLLVI